MSKIKQNLIVILLLLLIIWIPMNSYASTQNTIDDLRVLMGMRRLSEDGTMIEIKRLLSTSYKQKEWNELVVALGDMEDIQLEDFKEKEDAWFNAKDILESNFISNKPTITILNDYVNYQAKVSQRVEYSKPNAFELSLIDIDDIEKKVAYANSVLESTNDNTSIGVIGYKMKTFTQANLLITIPFGDSYSINSGKKQSSKGLTISINQDYKICSQFNGIVTAVTDNSVTIKTGKSVEVEYIGIQPSIGKKQKVKQYTVIGKTKAKNMTIKLKLNTVYVDPLLLYGSRSVGWYEQWENSNPGCTIDKNNYSNLIDNLSDVIIEADPELNNAGSMIQEDGNSEQIIIQGDNNYTDTPDNLAIDKSETGIIDNVK